MDRNITQPITVRPLRTVTRRLTDIISKAVHSALLPILLWRD
jgi:hypothetical protein